MNMLSSMTGFGRSVVDAPFGRLIVEIQSVNRKHFELLVSLPKELLRFENNLRKWIAEQVLRGHVSVRIQLIVSQEILSNILPDEQVLKNLKSKWENLSQKLELDPKQIDLPFLLSQIPLTEKTDLFHDEDLPVLRVAVEEALNKLCSMKLEEGKALALDVRKRLQMISEMVCSIEESAPEFANRMRQKWVEKMSSLLGSDQTLDERILKEVALLAEKVDISEELVRLRSHFVQFEETLKAKGAIGRKMDFILQELSREINTIGSKSCESKISCLVVEIKSELEKIREQIQNIE
jgi:uncharacterized protein (TIGR00255 family)